MYRVGRVGQAVEPRLHLLQDVCGGAVLRFAVVDLVQDGIEDLPRKNGKNIPTESHVWKMNAAVAY